MLAVTRFRECIQAWISSVSTIALSALPMERSVTRAQLEDFRVWLQSLNMDSLVKVAEVLDDLMADRELQQRERQRQPVVRSGSL